MSRAIKLPQYSDVKPFSAPDGVQVIPVDRNTWLPADSSCPEDLYIAFLDGTAPGGTCSHMGEAPQSFFQKLFGGGQSAPPVANPQSPPQPLPPMQNGQPQPPEPAPPKKKNLLQKLFGGGNKPAAPAPAQ